VNPQTGSPVRRRSLLRLTALPVAVFAGLAVTFAVGLFREDPSRVPSALIGKPVPNFNLSPLAGLERNGLQLPGLKSDDLAAGTVTVVNVWASWCAPCREEHPVLVQLSKKPEFRLVGINYKDKTGNALRFLGALGNPFERVGTDPAGKAAVDWGVYGVPETFIVDGKGTIRFKWIGPMTPDALRDRILPEITKAGSG